MGKTVKQQNEIADKVWAEIEASPLARVYVEELYRLAGSVVSSIASAKQLAPAPVPGGDGYVSPTTRSSSTSSPLSSPPPG